MRPTIRFATIAGAALILGAAVGAFGVLTTPLRFFDLVQPMINEITPAAFYAAYEKDPSDYIFIDVREADAYAKEHPIGAVNMPLETLYVQRHVLPKRGKTIALICGGNQASGVAYSYLQHFGFFNIMRVTGGLPAWKSAGLPTVVGSEPYQTSSASSSVSLQSSAVRCT
jgi:rhodanese-related sulfurtransferase